MDKTNSRRNQLRDTSTIDGTSNSDIKEDIYHNGTFKKRISQLIKNPELFSNHVFIIDECHIACEKGNTIDSYFQEIGLTKDILEKFNIKLILISATPDIVQAELINKIDKDWNFVKLEPGPNYKGFKYFKKKMIEDFEDFIGKDLDKVINNYSEPKYHIIRVKGKNGEKLKKKIMEIILKKEYICIEHNQNNKIENFKQFILEAPKKHTFIFIKDFFRASYRIRLSEHFGLIIEPSSNIKDVTVTAQGLIARFFGYYESFNFKGQKPLFVCDKNVLTHILNLQRISLMKELIINLEG